MAFCSSCGEKIEDYIHSCPKCGATVDSATVPDANSSERMRHTFTTVWLILGIVYSAIGGLSQLFVFDSSFSLSFSIRMFAVLTGLGQAACIFFILKWKKIAFWGLIGVSAFSLIIHLTGMSEIINKLHGEYTEDSTSILNVTSFIGIILYIISFWGVLQIRKNGKSAWSQLE